MQRIHRRASTLALAAIALVAAAGCGSSAGRPAVPAAQTAPRQATATQAFVSRRYGFRVTLTPHWSEADARVAWNGRTLQGLDSPAFANFTDRATGRALVVGSAAVA